MGLGYNWALAKTCPLYTRRDIQRVASSLGGMDHDTHTNQMWDVSSPAVNPRFVFTANRHNTYKCERV